jgi:5-methylcytosine-specific restriction endonuclease McrA
VICPHCGEPFDKTAKYQRYCSAPCSVEGRKERERQRHLNRTMRQHTGNCAWCSETFTHRQTQPQACCSRECADARKAEGKSCPVPYRNCAECGRTYLGSPKVCSEWCQKVRNKRAAQESYLRCRSPLLYPPAILACRECGGTFEAIKHRDRIYCSKDCTDRAHERTRRHRIRAGSRQGENFTLFEIAERDGWCCHLCQRTVTRGEWSMDHLVPVSKGGSHSRENVALAHKSCNSLRGNKDLTQRSLTG